MMELVFDGERIDAKDVSVRSWAPDYPPSLSFSFAPGDSLLDAFHPGVRVKLRWGQPWWRRVLAWLRFEEDRSTTYVVQRMAIRPSSVHIEAIELAYWVDWMTMR